MPINDLRCLICDHYRDTPNHYYTCEQKKETVVVPEPLTQFPRIDPDKNYEDYREDLETDGVLDLEKVKELAAQYEWLRINYVAILQSDLQNEFSKVGTHASWVVEAIKQRFHDEQMYQAEELIEIFDAGGILGETPSETLRDYFEYDEWKANER